VTSSHPPRGPSRPLLTALFEYPGEHAFITMNYGSECAFLGTSSHTMTWCYIQRSLYYVGRDASFLGTSSHQMTTHTMTWCRIDRCYVGASSLRPDTK
jgi:hypothetical protein